MNIHSLSVDDALRSLVTSGNGLSEDEASKRLLEYGPNDIRKVRRRPLYERFTAQFTHFLAILLWAASGLCFLSEYFHPGEGMLALGLAITAVILINAVFTFVQEYRAERAVEELKKLLPSNVRILREGTLREVRSEKVVPGDVILLNEGDRVPADARIIESARLTVNNAPLTGESDVIPRGPDEFSGEYLDSPNIVFAGTLVAGGSGRAVAFATGMSTEFGKIAHLTGGIQESPGPLQKEIIRITRIVAVIAVTTGIFFFGIGFLIGRGFWQNFLFAVGIIIANVPEGLLPTVTLSLAMGSQRMAKKKALIKTLPSVETLGSVTVICTDKTGTITKNRMEVRKVWSPGEDGSGPHDMLMTIAFLCNNAVLDDGRYRGDPTEVAILKTAREISDGRTAERIHEIPFDPERKRMTTVHAIDGRAFVFTKGAPEMLLSLCEKVLYGNDEKAISQDMRNTLMLACHSMMDEGMRVIAFAYKEMQGKQQRAQSTDDPSLPPFDKREMEGFDLESDLIFAGLMGLEDPPRPEVPDAVRKCHEAGIRVIMITGDAGRTGVSIARQIGLAGDDPVVVEGHELNKMTDGVLRQRLSSREIIFARMTPVHKMRVVSILEEDGERVAVTGDGVNDAPALKRANIGIAMGMTGTDVAREAADIVLLDDNFASIVNAVEEGRAIFENIRKFISYIFASNIPEIIPYIAYVVFGIPLPLTIMQILAVDLGTDIFPALALGAERPLPGVMKQPPRKPDERLLNFRVLGRAYFFLGPFEAAAGLFGFFFVLNAGGWQWGTMLPSADPLYLQATTACLAGIVVTQIGNVFACRSFRDSVFSLGIFSNRMLVSGIAAEIMISVFIIYHSWGNALFGTLPLPLNVWASLVPFGIGLLLAEEARKYVVRRAASN